MITHLANQIIAERNVPAGWELIALLVKALDFQPRGPVFNTTGLLQGRLSLSSFKGR